MAIAIDLWCWDLEGHDNVELARHLSAEERARAERYHFPADARRFVAGRGRLRAILSLYADQAPEDIVFALGEHGKPRLTAPDAPFFNFSDSGRIGAVGVCRERALGIDIEEIRRRDFMALSARYFSAREAADLGALGESERADAFFRCWTRKEAFLKAVGTGLKTPLNAFEVTLGETPAAFTRIDPAIDTDARAWSLAAFAPAPAYAGAIAVRAEGQELDIVEREAVSS